MTGSFRIITPQEWKCSLWSGGKTSEIAIFPADAAYATREFSWRISSATVDNEESDFTPLPGFSRFISTLDAPILLTHDRSELTLYPGTVHFFAGGEATHSKGRCSDFNLIFNPASCDARMQAFSFTKAVSVLPETLFGDCHSKDTEAQAKKNDPAYHDGDHESKEPREGGTQYILFCKEGTCSVAGTRLQKHETLICTDAYGWELKTDTFCEVFAIRIRNR